MFCTKIETVKNVICITLNSSYNVHTNTGNLIV